MMKVEIMCNSDCCRNTTYVHRLFIHVPIDEVSIVGNGVVMAGDGVTMVGDGVSMVGDGVSMVGLGTASSFMHICSELLSHRHSP